MRHIPEDELHAYLDQALSRTQCVEIESHLAECPSCRGMRDGIAALRDRTTALLAKLAPPTRPIPAYEGLRRVAAEVANQRRRRVHAIAWAASLIVAVGLGWSASSFTRAGAGERSEQPVAVGSTPVVPTPPVPAGRPSTPPPTTLAQAAESAAAPIAPEPRAAARPSRPAGALASRPGRRAVAEPSEARPLQALADAAADSVRAQREATLRVLSPTPTLELTNLEPAGRQEDLDGMWRTMSWDGAKAEAGERLPHIDGLPVVQVQVQSGDQSASSVTVVAQQLASGQVIRTIEGPATDVSQILSRHGLAEADSAMLADGSSRRLADGGHAMAMQVGDRMLAITGDLPSDSLRAMIRRLNAEMRSK
jgi:predicted anti-sigma-YlaC factor YlaD